MGLVTTTLGGLHPYWTLSPRHESVCSHSVLLNVSVYAISTYKKVKQLLNI